MRAGFVTLFELVAFLAALLGGYIIFKAIFVVGSAPAVGAMAAMGIGIAAIPYFIAAMAHRAYMRSRDDERP